jgi:hypothetical protein
MLYTLSQNPNTQLHLGGHVDLLSLSLSPLELFGMRFRLVNGYGRWYSPASSLHARVNEGGDLYSEHLSPCEQLT